MNRSFDSLLEGREAKIRFLPSDFEVLSPGSYVTCSVTGDRIPLDQLRYWNAERQEAYRDCEIATRRYEELRDGKA